MKKIFAILCATLALFACSKEQPVAVDENISVPMVFNFTVNHPHEAQPTKALKNGWEEGDVIYVFFNTISGGYLRMRYNGSSWFTSPEGNLSANLFEGISDSNKRMTAVYIPHENVMVDYDDVEELFTFTDKLGQPIYTYYMIAESVPYTVTLRTTPSTTATVNGTLDMTKPNLFVQFFVPGISEDEAPLYRLREDSLAPKALIGVYTDAISHCAEEKHGVCLKGFPYKGGVLFSGLLISAGVATDYSFQLVKYVSETLACAEGTYVIEGNRTISPGVVMRFPGLDDLSWTYSKWVDMGPAGKWATGNLTDDGGTTIGEANLVPPGMTGKYYAWGETSGHEPNGESTFSHSFSWSTTPYNISSIQFSKYTDTDFLTQLEAIDDAAIVNLGSNWHIPTKAEYEMLVDPTDYLWEWQNSNALGSIVTSKETGLSMFMPSTGFGGSSQIHMLGQIGYYWTSTRWSQKTYAACPLYFDDSGKVRVEDDQEDPVPRYYGMAVRPVLN